MDRMTRNLIFISSLLLLLLIVSLALQNYELRPRVWQLNALLEDDPQLSAYPYRFKVVLFLNGIATLTSPHADEVPLEPFLTRVDSALQAEPGNAALLEAARAALRAQEMRAIQVLVAQPDVDSVVWSLDRAWYHAHGIRLP